MKKSQQTKTLTISLPIALYKTLELKAQKNDRSKNYLVRKALEVHLDGTSSEKASKKTIPYTVVNRRPGDIASCYATAKKANTELNWKANRTLAEMCSSGWEFQRRLYGGNSAAS